jgi:hypothetical protein
MGEDIRIQHSKQHESKLMIPGILFIAERMNETAKKQNSGDLEWDNYYSYVRDIQQPQP